MSSLPYLDKRVCLVGWGQGASLGARAMARDRSYTTITLPGIFISVNTLPGIFISVIILPGIFISFFLLCRDKTTGCGVLINPITDWAQTGKQS